MSKQWFGVNWGNGAPGDTSWQDIDRFEKVGLRRDRWRKSLLVECDVAVRIMRDFYAIYRPSLEFNQETLLEVLHTIGLEIFLQKLVESYGEERVAPYRAKIQEDPEVIAAKAAIGPEVPTRDQYRNAGDHAVEVAASKKAQGFSELICRIAAKEAFQTALHDSDI